MNVMNMKYGTITRYNDSSGNPYSWESFKITKLSFIPNNIIILPQNITTNVNNTTYGVGFLDLQATEIVSYPLSQTFRYFQKDSSGEEYTFGTSSDKFIIDVRQEEDKTYTLTITPPTTDYSFDRIMSGTYWWMVYKTL